MPKRDAKIVYNDGRRPLYTGNNGPNYTAVPQSVLDEEFHNAPFDEGPIDVWDYAPIGELKKAVYLLTESGEDPTLLEKIQKQFEKRTGERYTP